MKYTRFPSLVAILTVSLVLTCGRALAKDTQEFASTRPVPRNDAGWLARHEVMNQRAKQGNVDLLMIGDSITHGWEGAGKEVWKKFYEKRNAVNLGIGGDQTQHVLWRLDHGNIDGIQPKLAVLMIGTNNAGCGNPEEIAAGVRAIVEKLRAKLPKTKVLLLAIFPRGPDANDRLRQVNSKANQIIARLEDNKDVFFMDISWKLLAKDGTLSRDIMPDLLHPNARGYAIWADTMDPLVRTLMGEEFASTKPVPRSEAWWQEHHQGINRRIAGGNVDLVMIGDSITDAWAGQGKEVWKKFYEKRSAVNLGIGGDQTQQVLWRLDNGNIDGIRPKLAVLMIGTNNVGCRNPQEIAAGVRAIVEKLRAKLPQTKVLVLAIFPRGADDKDRNRRVTSKVNPLIAKLADDKDVFFLDIGPKFLGKDGTLSKDIMPDFLHPNAKGYEIWAEAMEPTVKKLMGEE